MPPVKSHLTAFVLSLTTEDEVQRATSALLACSSLVQGKPAPRIRLSGLGAFGQNVIYVRPLPSASPSDRPFPSANGNSKKGGLIALAAVVIGLGRDSYRYIHLVVPPVTRRPPPQRCTCAGCMMIGEKVSWKSGSWLLGSC